MNFERAIDSGARIIGVNNRDLHTFEVHLETSLTLADRIPCARHASRRERHSFRRRMSARFPLLDITRSWSASI